MRTCKPNTLLRISLPLMICFFSALSCIGPRSTVYRLPGCLRVDDKVVMKATEVNVYDYMEFVAANGYDPSLFPADNDLPYPAYQALLRYYKGPDHSKHTRSQAWDSIWHAYHDLPLNSPITGVSYDQALRYCQWFEEKTRKEIQPSYLFHISLPTVELYRHLIPAVDTLSAPHRCPMFNYVGAGASSCKTHWKTPLVRVDAFWPSKEGIYGLRGNAAEMTATKGIAMGGSFRHYAYEASPDHQQLYTKPEDWLGFRYIVTME